MIQNAATRLVFNELKRVHVTPLFISLHWLLVAARIKFKTLTLVQPQAQRPSTSTHCYESTFPPEVWDPLVSDTSLFHHREAKKNYFPEHFWTSHPYPDGLRLNTFFGPIFINFSLKQLFPIWSNKLSQIISTLNVKIVGSFHFFPQFQKA